MATFSRAPLPYLRSDQDFQTLFQSDCLGRHYGIYGYRKSFLAKYARLEPAEMEVRESLEQLRALYHGYKVQMVTVDDAAFGVDTQEDLDRARNLLKEFNY